MDPSVIKLDEKSYQDEMLFILKPGELEPKTWYQIRLTSPGVKELGCYAIGYIVMVDEIKPNRDEHKLTIIAVTADGKLLDPADGTIAPNGIIKSSDEPAEEAFLVGYDGFMPNLGIEIVEDVPVYAGV